MLPWVAAALFVSAFAGASTFVASTDYATAYGHVAEFSLWVGVLSALAGYGAATAAYFLTWLVGLVRLGRSISAWTVLSWVALVVVVGGIVFAFLFVGGAAGPESPNRELWAQTRPLTVVVALLQAPGLIAFLGLRHLAASDDNWHESGLCRLRLVRRVREELRRLLATYGAFLTLLVIATGLRRRAVLAADPDSELPAESVLLYGLIFAVLLGLFYLAAASAIDHRAQKLVDEFAPLPDPAHPELLDQVHRRTELVGLTGSPGTWRTFETTVVIAAPLLSALIGIATGE